MTVRQTPEAKARKRHVTAAGKSLKLIADEVARHQAALAAGEIPDGDFSASVRKYFESLAAARALDSLGGEAAGDNGMAEVNRHDLAEFIGLVQGLVPALAGIAPDTPFGQLVTAAEGPPWTQDELPASGPGKE